MALWERVQCICDATTGGRAIPQRDPYWRDEDGAMRGDTTTTTTDSEQEDEASAESGSMRAPLATRFRAFCRRGFLYTFDVPRPRVEGHSYFHRRMGKKMEVVYVIDCPAWTVQASALLRTSCPQAMLSVESSVSSLSGFAVVVYEEGSGAQAWMERRLSMAIAVGVAVLASAAWLFLREENDSTRGLF